MTTIEVAEVVGAAFTAVASLAALAAVRHATRAWRTSLLPELHGQPRVAPNTWQTMRMDLVIHNAGGGVAKTPLFVLVANGGYVAGHVDVGFLRSGETIVVKTGIPAKHEDVGVPATGVLVCRDADESAWGWSLRGERKLLRRGKRRWWERWRDAPQYTAGATEMLNAFYPDIDLNDLEPCYHEVQAVREPPARAPTGTRTGTQAPL